MLSTTQWAHPSCFYVYASSSLAGKSLKFTYISSLVYPDYGLHVYHRNFNSSPCNSLISLANILIMQPVMVWFRFNPPCMLCPCTRWTPAYYNEGNMFPLPFTLAKVWGHWKVCSNQVSQTEVTESFVLLSRVSHAAFVIFAILLYCWHFII